MCLWVTVQLDLSCPFALGQSIRQKQAGGWGAEKHWHGGKMVVLEDHTGAHKVGCLVCTAYHEGTP